jgi:hypothetical protein
VRCAAGLGQVDLYTAARHYFGWYVLNVLGLPPHLIALQLGHRDGGGLVRENYGRGRDRAGQPRAACKGAGPRSTSIAGARLQTRPVSSRSGGSSFQS